MSCFIKQEMSRDWTHPVTKPGSLLWLLLNLHQEVCSHGPAQALPTLSRTREAK